MISVYMKVEKPLFKRPGTGFLFRRGNPNHGSESVTSLSESLAHVYEPSPAINTAFRRRKRYFDGSALRWSGCTAVTGTLAAGLEAALW